MILKDLTEALEQELDAAMRLARRTASVEAVKEPHTIRLAVELRTNLAEQDILEAAAEHEQLRADREQALSLLDAARQEQTSLRDQLSAADGARKAAEGSLKKLRGRLKELEALPAPSSSVSASEGDASGEHSALVAGLRAALERERIARMAAEADLSFVEGERDRLMREVEDSRQDAVLARAAADELRRLADDLHAELMELWRVLRETRPGDTFSINLSLSDSGTRRAGVERMQSKVIDARELFKRRSQRWPLAM
jgi:small-conductance mechanosensitive channel